MMENSNPACFKAYNLIKGKIIRNELDTRQRLNEISLAKGFGLSRTPVREALIMLEKEELITRYDRTRGFYVKQYSLQDVYDLYEYREIIETATAEQLIANVTDQHIERLNEIMDQVRKIIDQKRPADALVRAVDLHLLCIQICTGNSFIIKSMRNCFEKIILISWTCNSLDTCIRSVGEHEQIITALKKRDLALLTKTIQQHTRGARDRILDTLKINTQRLYFLP